MGFEPLGDRVLIRPDEAEAVSAGGIVLPEQAQDKPQQGVVVGVGEGVGRGEEVTCADLAEGDTVVYSKYGGTEVEVEGEALLLVLGKDLIGRIR